MALSGSCAGMRLGALELGTVWAQLSLAGRWFKSRACNERYRRASGWKLERSNRPFGLQDTDPSSHLYTDGNHIRRVPAAKDLLWQTSDGETAIACLPVMIDRLASGYCRTASASLAF